MRKKNVAQKKRPAAFKAKPARKTAPVNVAARQVMAELRAQIKKHQRRFDLLSVATLGLKTESAFEDNLQILAATAAEFLSADAVSCSVWDRVSKNLVFRAGHGFCTRYLEQHRLSVERLLGFVPVNQEIHVIEDLRATAFTDQELVLQEGLVSVLTIFLRYEETVLGAIHVFSRHRIRRFTPEDMEDARLFGQQATIAYRNLSLYGELREEAQISKTLLQVAEDVGTLTSLDEVLNRIVLIVTRALSFKISVIFLWNRQKHLYLPAKAIGLLAHRSPLFDTLILQKSELSFNDQELKQREVIFAQKSPRRFPMEKIASVLEFRDLCMVPLVTKGKLLGVLINCGYHGEEPFDFKDELFLRGIAAQAAIAIDDANLFQDLENAFWDIIKSLAAAIEVKDRYTHSHSESVIAYGVALARALKMSDPEIDMIRKACLLHDVGKIGVEDGILRKVTPLTQEERWAIERHPVIGAEILASVSSLTEISKIVRHHHEHYNGQGYPDHLQGDNIPRMSRILQIADSFDAMTSDRPYRKALSREQAMEELRRQAGRQFDPELVGVFLSVLQKNDLPKSDTGQHKIRTP